jgi:predicted ATPase
LGSPFLTEVWFAEERVEEQRAQQAFPFDGAVAWISRATAARAPDEPRFSLEFKTPVTFLVGENGSGKSTLLEALAWRLGYGAEGGNKDQSFTEGADGHSLGRALHWAWRQRVSDGFFLRAETFFNFATYLESVGSTFGAYGGRSLHQQSHGEGYLSLFQHRIEDGLYLLDEPEAALSPTRQLAFLSILHRLSEAKTAQFLIATHSPILITLPGATILQFDGDSGEIRRVDYWQTEHFQLTKDFLNSPQRFYRHLDEEGEPPSE